MRELVDQTFLEVDANSDGRISFEEFKEMVRRHPAVLNTITIDSSVLW
jgi:Ca2+-binding EF-hand superfamily protein